MRGSIAFRVFSVVAGFEEHDRDFVFCDRAVFDPFGHDQELALFKLNILTPELHFKLAAQREEHLVFLVVLVPNKLAFELGEFDLLAIELSNDHWAPMFGKEHEFFIEVDLVHAHSSSVIRVGRIWAL